MKRFFYKIGFAVLIALSGCKFGRSEEETDAQAPRKGPVAALLNQESRSTAADAWSILLPSLILLDSKEEMSDRMSDICKSRSLGFPKENVTPSCLDGDGHVPVTAATESSCVGAEHDRTAEAALNPIRRGLAVFTEVFCKAKSIGLIAPSKKPSLVDLSDFKDAFALQSGDRVSLTDAFTRAEKQTKGMYHSYLKGNLVDHGLRFSYDIVHLPHDKAGKESGGRIVVTEQNGEKLLVVSATYEIEEGMLSLHATRIEAKPVPAEQITSLFNSTTGLLDLDFLRGMHPPLRLLAWPSRVDVERDFNRRTLRIASQSLFDWQSSLTKIGISTLHYDEDKSGQVDGCGIVGLGGRWDLMSRISIAGISCMKGSKVQRFVQKECFSRKSSEAVWNRREQKIAFAPSEECGLGSESFNLELLNEEGNTQEVQSFDPTWPSLPGIPSPTYY